jgi:amidase
MKVIAVLALGAALAGAQAQPAPRKAPEAPARGFALEEATIEQLRGWLKSGRYTSAALTRMYLERIRALDKLGPRLNAVIELNPDALSIAAAGAMPESIPNAVIDLAANRA